MWRGSRSIGGFVWFWYLLWLVSASLFGQAPAPVTPPLSVAESSPQQQSLDAEFLAVAAEMVEALPQTKPFVARMSAVFKKISAESKANTKALTQTIDEQAKKIAEQKDSIAASQTTIDSQASKLKENEKTIADLKTSQTASTDYQNDFEQSLRDDAANMQTSSTIGWTLFGVAALGDVIQAFILAFRP